MKKHLLTIAILTIGYTAPSYALQVPQNVVCSNQGKSLIFNVSFDADFENGIIITNTRTGKVAMTFNNQVGRGAGSEWRLGAGTWQSPPGCYRIKAMHKNGPANPNLPWVNSKLRRTVYTFGFEDGIDNDFNDAVVVIQR